MRPSKFIGAALLSLSCGATPERIAADSGCIRGGDKTTDYPAVVAVTGTDGKISVACSGTVIEARTVLTAAHCLDHDGIGEYSVRFGANIRDTTTSTVIMAYDWDMHPDYSWEHNSPSDIALLYLEEDAPVEPAPLYRRYPTIDAQITQVGYGVNDNGGNFGVKYVGTDAIADFLDKDFLTSTSGSTADKGDSGGPAFIGVHLAGVQSRLTSGGANIYTSVIHYLDFINIEEDCNE